MYNPPILINSYIMYKAILLKQNGNARATFIYINYKLYSPCFKKAYPFYEKWLFFLALSTIIKLVLSKFHNKIRLLCRRATRMVQRKEVIMKFLKQNSVNLLISLCELIIGILLLIDPTGFSNGIIIAFGAACLAFGVVQIVFYWEKTACRGNLAFLFDEGTYKYFRWSFLYMLLPLVFRNLQASFFPVWNSSSYFWIL